MNNEINKNHKSSNFNTELFISEFINPDYKMRRILDWDFFANCKDSFFWQSFNKDELTINLKGIDIFKNEGIAWIENLLLVRRINNKKTKFLLPDNDDQIFRLIASGFIQKEFMLNFTFEDRDSLVNKNLDFKSALDNIYFVKSNNVEKLSTQISSIVSNHLARQMGKTLGTSESAGIEIDLTRFISEILRNISAYGDLGVQKSASYKDIDLLGIKGFAVITPPLPKFRWFRISFFDIGNGFKYTLSQKQNKKGFHNNIATERDAILTGLLYRYYNKETKILGLYHLLGFIRRNRGKISIRSGNSLVYVNLAKRGIKDLFESQYEKKPTYEWLLNFVEPNIDICNIRGSYISIDFRV